MPGNRALAMFALAALLLAVPLALAQVPPEALITEPLAQPAEQAEEQAEGEVSAVDVENSTVTLSTADGEELVLNVTESTRVTKEGVEELGMGSAGLEQIAEGDSVSVSYNPESMEALSIDVLPAEEPEEESGATQQPRRQDENETAVEEPALPEEEVSAPVSEQPENETAETEMGPSTESGEVVEGKVTGVNTNSNFLVIQTPEGEYLAFRLTDDTAVVSEAGQETGIEGLSFGVDVSVEYDAQTKNVLEVTVLSAPEAEENVSAPAPEEEVSAPLEPAPEAEENVSAPAPEENTILEP